MSGAFDQILACSAPLSSVSWIFKPAECSLKTKCCRSTTLRSDVRTDTLQRRNKEWLFPERHVSTDHWRNLGGDGWLLMPEPRLLHMGGDIYVGYEDGSSDAWSPYGHK